MPERSAIRPFAAVTLAATLAMALHGCASQQQAATEVDPLAEFLAATQRAGGEPVLRPDASMYQPRPTAPEPAAARQPEPQVQFLSPDQMSHEPDAQPIRPRVAAVQAAPRPTEAIAESDAEPDTAGAGTVAVSQPMAIADAVPKAAANPKAMSTDALLAALKDRLKAVDDDRLRAVRTAALSVVDPSVTLDDMGLSADERQAVELYRQLLTQLTQAVSQGDGQLSRDELQQQVDRLFEGQPISIRTVKLCKRVRGFGVYEAFEQSVFLAGRTQKMIIYVELDNFRTDFDASTKEHTVQLTQELILYTEADGTAVWRQPAVTVKDTSFNKRRDFFVVQMIALPSRLSVGQYLLKVRVTDTVGQTVDERTLPLRMVADAALVSAGE